MIAAQRAPVGETRAYALGDVRFVRGIASHGRACVLVWRAGAYEVVSQDRVIARRGSEVAGWSAAQEYVAQGYVSEVVS